MSVHHAKRDKDEQSLQGVQYCEYVSEHDATLSDVKETKHPSNTQNESERDRAHDPSQVLLILFFTDSAADWFECDREHQYQEDEIHLKF